MHSTILRGLVAILFALVVDGNAVGATPRVTDDRYQLELIATDPQIVTPVGIAFDCKGRLLVVESHTHQRAEGYDGPATDRIRLLSDSDGDDKLDKWSTFAEGFRHTMNILARDDGAVYVVERGRIILLRDTDNDGVADKQDELLRLETKADYPHNGLSGIAHDVDGSLIIGLGENFGEPYELKGADGTTFKGSGGQDGIFRMSPDGKNLKRFARGVWNPFSVCVLPDGRTFTVDNDPDSSPPCRLLHIVPGGDYGYLFQYGRAGTHPLQSWNGELPGTLPMVCGVGEAPTAIVPHAGGLWVTSWGDHRIERYDLVPRGASYGATRAVLVQGGADFRPTGMALAPDGSLYFADWVLRDYPVHGRGKIWRLSLPGEELKRTFPSRSQQDIAADKNGESLAQDPFVQARMAWNIAHDKRIEGLAADLAKADGPATSYRKQVPYLAALRWHGAPHAEELLRACLADHQPDTMLYAIRWIADERITTLRDDVAKLLDGPQTNSQLYLALLGAVDWLDREPHHRGADFNDELLVRELTNDNRPPEAHAFALRLLSPDHKFLTVDPLRDYFKSNNLQLRLEAIRTLSQQSAPDRGSILAEVANDESQSDQVRAEAIAGLAPFYDQYLPAMTLRGFLQSDNATLRREAERACRLAVGSVVKEIKPLLTDMSAWEELLAKPGDAESGRRLFFSQIGPRCSVCHSFNGRGGKVGPDLTRISKSTTREKMIASILQPSQEIAPDYQSWRLVTTDGKSYTGLRLPKAGDDGRENYIDFNGIIVTLPSAEIEERHASDKSIMPDNLHSTLTIDDLRHLVTFLASTPANR